MCRFLSSLILMLTLLAQEPGAAQANPVFLHALSDRELAENSAGEAIAIRLEENARNDRIAAMATDAPMRDLFSIRTIVLDSGVSSTTEAATSLSVRATLQDVSLRPAF